MFGGPGYSSRFDEAMALAVEAFRPVKRKATGVPYLSHLMQVCVTVTEFGGDEDLMIAALLHDYLEDIEGSSVQELERDFGARVAELVLALSDTTHRPKPPWRERKERYLSTLADKSEEVWLLCAADKLHNCRSLLRDHRAIGDEVFLRLAGKKDGTKWYYNAIVVALSARWSHPLLDELRADVKELLAL